MLRLGFDIDEVMCFTVDRVIAYLKDNWEVNITRESVKLYEFNKHPQLIDNKELVEDLYYQFKHPSLDFFKECEPDKEGIDVIRKLKRQGHLIHFVTSRPIGAEGQTALWFRKYKIPFNHIKHVGKSVNKGKACKKLKLDFFMDDYGGCLDSLLEQKKTWKKGLILFDKPWNHAYSNDRVLRVKSWYEVLRKLGI